VIEIRNLVVRYRSSERNVYAVDKVSLEIGKGIIFGPVGEFGSGKTTLGLSLLRIYNQ
jgi:ABC-type oligopeptide transport system ATPase subunit